MRRTLAARCIRCIVPAAAVAAVAAALASGLPRAAEARMGGGGGGLGGGGFGMGGLGNLGGLGGFHGGFAPGGVVGAAQRGAIGVYSTAQREALGLRNGGVVVFRGGHAFPHGDAFAFGSGHGFSHGGGAGHGWSYGWGYDDGYGRVGIPPLLGTSVPPPATATVPRSGGSAGPRPVRAGVGVAEVWRRDGGAWHVDPAPPQSVAVWRRGDDGRWRAEAAD